MQDIALQQFSWPRAGLHRSQLERVGYCINQLICYFNSILEMSNVNITAEEAPIAKEALLQWFTLSEVVWDIK